MRFSSWRVSLGLSAMLVGLSSLTSSTSCVENDTPLSEAARSPDPGAGRALGWKPGEPGLPARRASGQAEIAEAVRGLEAAGSTCSDACPSLLALRLGVTHLCGVTDTKYDFKVCVDNKKLLADAEAKLKAPCNACAPEVEKPDASDY
jgi:hypothetical protein